MSDFDCGFTILLLNDVGDEIEPYLSPFFTRRREFSCQEKKIIYKMLIHSLANSGSLSFIDLISFVVLRLIILWY